MKISRRDFVAYGSGLLSSLIPSFSIAGNPMERAHGLFSGTNDQNLLVIIHLAGGNDWFNTIIPYQSSVYYQQRPSLAISSKEVLELDSYLAMHPALADIKKLYDQNCLAVLLNVGYPQATLSHHKAIEEWQYVSNKQLSDITWQGRYAKYTDKEVAGRQIFPAINVQPDCSIFDSLSDQNKNNSAAEVIISCLNGSKKFEFDLGIHYKIDGSKSNYQGVSTSDISESSLREIGANKLLINHKEENGFLCAMKVVAKLIKEKTNASIYNVSLGGFDTHNHQLLKHAFLLETLSKGIMSFQTDLEKNGLADRVLTVISSEFGRELKENDSSGTDHGYVNHILAIGNGVKGGIYGSRYIADLDGANKYNFDYRSLYSSLLNKWLSCPSEAILGQKFETLSFV